MNSLFSASGVALCLAAATAVPIAMVRAQGTAAKTPPPTNSAKASDTLKCPACGMAMPTKKTAATTVPIKVDGKQYYCCAGCASGTKAAAYSKAHKGAVMNVSTAKPAAPKSSVKKS